MSYDLGKVEGCMCQIRASQLAEKITKYKNFFLMLFMKGEGFFELNVSGSHIYQSSAEADFPGDFGRNTHRDTKGQSMQSFGGLLHTEIT